MNVTFHVFFFFSIAQTKQKVFLCLMEPFVTPPGKDKVPGTNNCGGIHERSSY